MSNPLNISKVWTAELEFDYEIPPGAFVRMATPGDAGFYMARLGSGLQSDPGQLLPGVSFARVTL
jgi:hypothetical protein